MIWDVQCPGIPLRPTSSRSIRSASSSCPDVRSCSHASPSRRSAVPVSWWKEYRWPRARSTVSSASVSLPTASAVASSTSSGIWCSGAGASSVMGGLYPARGRTHDPPGDIVDEVLHHGVVQTGHKTLTFDPIDEAARQWGLRWDAVDQMHAVTSLMRVQQLVLAQLDDLLREHGLSFARYEALVLLTFSRAGALPLGKMGQRLQVHPTSVTSIVDRLEAAGLVVRRPHPQDGRAVLAEITPAGRSVVEAATNDLVEARFAIADVAPDDLRSISALLRPVREHAGDF